MAGIMIERSDGPAGGRYSSRHDGRESEMTYTRTCRDKQELMVIDHTLVPEELAGRGVGLALMRRAVEDARAEGLKILPVCSFARVMLARHDDLRDVIADGSV
ncbi:MAG: GNAT family N-acetyltransferase [Alphaproteobacteria bacterium]|nr:GNAT family N-acetyltransferase [Alphaproteobacteria bacterium]